jgi:hypothetical protein
MLKKDSCIVNSLAKFFEKNNLTIKLRSCIKKNTELTENCITPE